MRVSVLVSGRVQGVGYRRFVQRHARDLGLTGYAENLRDGRVEVIAEGDRAGLERLLHWIRRGPPHSQVDEVDVQWNEKTGLSGFHVY